MVICSLIFGYGAASLYSLVSVQSCRGLACHALHKVTFMLLLVNSPDVQLYSHSISPIFGVFYFNLSLSALSCIAILLHN